MAEAKPSGDPVSFSYLWLAGNEGMEQKMETTIMGFIGITDYYKDAILHS